MRIAFAECVFDPDTREVFRDGRAVALSPKAFELLELLVRERPRALSKQRIHEELWPKVFVSDASLSNVVAELRAALGDDARNARILRTVQRFGYAFVAEASVAAPAPAAGGAFRLIWETREISLHGGENIIGRDHRAVVWVDDPSVSRHHARILLGDGGAVLEDLGSKNGTFLNGAELPAPARLADGDEIRIGLATMTLRVLREVASTQTVSGLRRATRTRKS